MADQTVRFSRSIYRLDGIEAAAEAYAGLARITVTPGDTEIVVDLCEPSADIPADELCDAFCNHALFETVRAYRLAVGGAL